jgi:excisionase family DNA binding protein
MPTQFEGETYLSTKEACERIKVSRDTLNRFVHQKRLKRYKMKGVTSYYKESEIDSVISMREVEQNNQTEG